MATIMICNPNDEVQSRLRVRAAGNCHSVEDEGRLVLREPASRNPSSQNLVAIIRQHSRAVQRRGRGVVAP